MADVGGPRKSVTIVRHILPPGFPMGKGQGQKTITVKRGPVDSTKPRNVPRPGQQIRSS